MCRASLVALALLAPALLPSCGMRFSGSHSSGSSFTVNVPDRLGSHKSIGSLSADYGYSDYTARSFSAVLTLNPDLPVKDYELHAFIFQDLDGDSRYSPGADRLLAKSDAAIRDSSTNQLTLNPIEFTFKPRHEPIGISWIAQDATNEVELNSRLFR